MEYLGFFCLGAFVGGFLSMGIAHLGAMKNFAAVITTVFGAAFAGAVLGFINILNGGDSGKGIYLYPVGLLVALLWYYGRNASKWLTEGTPIERILGGVHMLALVLISFLALLLTIAPALADVRAIMDGAGG